ncbi:predicted protein [Sclerotinia sclerotiorum 1980 UF-70]|uniref:Uncharacterized protein n=1 Tax=Sclerotinia sclerotiorum (strain ATCC 18683 / 1980 / Ss-1) TaxID=665079 RepID=A7EQC9_SCLS1|nr:predicted protein [Sclerotinia sclerotiorum 1980 UF-70]EDO05045.1 predicted protein [Sclerotinia sclerotiorum 1980 UF-70]
MNRLGASSISQDKNNDKLKHEVGGGGVICRASSESMASFTRTTHRNRQGLFLRSWFLEWRFASYNRLSNIPSSCIATTDLTESPFEKCLARRALDSFGT